MIKFLGFYVLSKREIDAVDKEIVSLNKEIKWKDAMITLLQDKIDKLRQAIGRVGVS